MNCVPRTNKTARTPMVAISPPRPIRNSRGRPSSPTWMENVKRSRTFPISPQPGKLDVPYHRSGNGVNERSRLTDRAPGFGKAGSHPAALFLCFFSGSLVRATTGSTISPQFRHLQAWKRSSISWNRSYTIAPLHRGQRTPCRRAIVSPSSQQFDASAPTAISASIKCH